MSVFDWLREGFGLAPLRDVDLPDEPSATVTRLADRVRPADTSTRDGLRAHTCVGGPAAPVTPGAAGIHPSQWQTGQNVQERLCDIVASMDAIVRAATATVEAITDIQETLDHATSVTSIKKGRPSRE